MEEMVDGGCGKEPRAALRRTRVCAFRGRPIVNPADWTLFEPVHSVIRSLILIVRPAMASSGPHPVASAQMAVHFDYASYSGWQHISAKLDGEGVLLITLNRPQQHNAFSGAMMLDLVFVFQLAHHDDRVKVVVLTGAGKSFCAGADLSTTGFGVDESAPLEEHRDGGGQQVLAMLNCSKLIIAAINGNAVGIGLTMTLAADLRICAEG